MSRESLPWFTIKNYKAQILDIRIPGQSWFSKNSWLIFKILFVKALHAGIP